MKADERGEGGEDPGRHPGGDGMGRRRQPHDALLEILQRTRPRAARPHGDTHALLKPGSLSAVEQHDRNSYPRLGPVSSTDNREPVFVRRNPAVGRHALSSRRRADRSGLHAEVLTIMNLDPIRADQAGSPGRLEDLGVVRQSYSS